MAYLTLLDMQTYKKEKRKLLAAIEQLVASSHDDK